MASAGKETENPDRVALLDELNQAGLEQRNATMVRDSMIRTARGAGLPLRAIATAVGLSTSAVAKISERR